MNETTKVANSRFMPEFSNRFVYVLVVLAGATLLTVFTSRLFWHELSSKNIGAFPDAIALRTTVQYGIDEFQGTELTDLSTKAKSTMLALIIVNFVLAPIGFVLAWKSLLLDRERQARGETGGGRHWLRPALLVVCGVILGHLAIVNIITAIILPQGFKTMVWDNVVDQARNDVVADLTDAGINAFQYYYLPEASGGGGQSFRSWKNKGLPATLEEMGIPAKTAHGTYTLKEIRNDTLLVLRGISPVVLSIGSSPEYEFQVSPGTPSPPEFRVAKIN